MKRKKDIGYQQYLTRKELLLQPKTELYKQSHSQTPGPEDSCLSGDRDWQGSKCMSQ